MTTHSLGILTVVVWTIFPIHANSEAHKPTKAAEKVATQQSQSAAPDGSNESSQQATLEPMLSPDLFTGTLNMQVPLDLPPGRAGIQADLRLQYQNGNANGPLGVGWRLEPGTIQLNPLYGALHNCDERVPGNSCYLISFQGARYPIVLGVDGKYAARQEGRFFRIRKLLGLDGKETWEITDKKGTKFMFGDQDSSRQTGSGRVFKWFLDRVEDTNGNYMLFSYQAIGNDTYLNDIQYTGHRNIMPNVVTTFAYEPRSDVYNHYEFGGLISTAQRLKTITSQVDGIPIKRYELTYQVSPVTYRSVLFKVLVYGNDLTTTTPAIYFQSKQFQNGWFAPPYAPWGGGPNVNPVVRSQCFQGDFNGDGRLDLACYTGTSGLWHVALSNSGGWSAPHWWYGPTPPGDVSVSCIAADFNGDSKTDIACYQGGGKWSLALSNAGGWSSVIRDNGPSPNGSVQDRCLAGNFIVPGVAAIACWSSSDIWQVAILSSGSSWNTVSLTKGPSPNASVWKKCVSLDLIGDDRAEIACTEGNGIWNVAQAGAGEWSTVPWSGPVADIPLRYSFVGDFNGDGLQDLICYHLGHWVVGLSTGTAFDVQDWGGDPAIAYAYCIQGDFNGDSKTDIACYNIETNKWRVALSTGASLVGADWAGGGSFVSSSCFAGDAIGSGKTDLVCYSGGDAWTITTPKFEIPDAIATVIHPLGGVSELEYQYSTQTLNNHIPFNVNLISRVSNRAEMSGPTYQKQFVYDGGAYVRRWREFRGFGHVKVTEPADTDAGVLKEYWFHQGATFGLVSAAEGLIGNLKEVVVSDLSGTALRRIHIDYSVGSDIPPYFDPPRKIDSYTYGDPTPLMTVAKYAYDSFGNIVEEDKLGTRPTEIKVTTRNYSSDIPNWIVGLPTNETTFSDLAKLNRVTSTNLYYDEVHGLPCGVRSDHRGNLSRVVRWSSDLNTPNQEVRFGYDALGNLTCRSDARGKINKTTYDPRFLTFPTSFQNALGQSIYIEYSQVNSASSGTSPYGSILKITDLNKNYSRFKYDALGRLTTFVNPDNSETTTVYDFTPTYNRVTTTFPESMVTKLYLDGFGRVVREEMSGPASTTIERDRQFNRSGQLRGVSFPYFKGIDIPQWNKIGRDALGRVFSVLHPDGNQTTVCYKSMAAAAVDENGHWSLYRSDWNGNVTDADTFLTVRKQCSDAMFTGVDPSYSHVGYTYDTLGRLKRVVDPAQNETTLTWNSLGNVTAIHDPERGTRKLTYDPNGNVTKSTDARGDQVFWNYDDLNRPVKKEMGSKNKPQHLIAKLDYDLNSNGIGNLFRVHQPIGTVEYFYDKENRPTEMRQKVRGHKMIWQNKYDGLGRLTSFNYPSGAQIKYTYDAPFEDSIRMNDSLLSKTTRFTALGQPVEIVGQNGISTRYSYYDGISTGCSLPSFRLCTVGIFKNLVPIRILQYQYDPKGNISGIKADAETQALVYDPLDRLINVTSNAPSGNESFSFDAVGNIKSKSDVGTYLYGANPQAVVTAGKFTYSYDANGNEITGAGRRLSYDKEQRLITISSPLLHKHSWGFLFPRSERLSFEYDWTGSRSEIVRRRMLPYPFVWLVPGKKTVTIGNLCACQGRKCWTYVHRGQALAIQVDPKKAISYVYTDVLRSTRLLTDGTGHSISSANYSSYGSSREPTSTKESEIRFRFTGQHFDSPTGLYYFGARYYDPSLGRFVSPDLRERVDDVQAMNGYSYVRNNPQSLTDPTGMQDDGTGEDEPDVPEAPSPDNPGQQEDQNLSAPAGSMSMSIPEMQSYDAEGRTGFESDQNTNFIGQRSSPGAPRPGPFSGPPIINLSVEEATIDVGSARASLSILGQVFYSPTTGLIYYPPHITFMMAEQDTDWFLIGGSFGSDVGIAQGDVKQGAPGGADANVIGLIASGGIASNQFYSNRTVSVGAGVELGKLKGPSYTVSLFGGPFSSRDVQEAISRLLMQTATFGWPMRREGNLNRINTNPFDPSSVR